MINIKFLVVIIYNIFIYYINLSLAKEMIIKNNSENFYNIKNVIVENQNDSQLILKFLDNYYDFSLISNQIKFEVLSNITFVGGNKGTIFDFVYGEHKSENIILQFLASNGNSVIFKNITFQNYSEDVNRLGVMMFIVSSRTDNFLVEFENCNFINNSYPLMQLDVSYNKETNKEAYYVVENCNF